jgi:hypothetical protein
MRETRPDPNTPICKYQISYGFFLRKELEEKYPNFYSKKCEISFNK